MFADKTIRKVLIIAYFWPPENCAGTHRPLRFTCYLRDYGWEPVVLTADPIFLFRLDPTLEKKLPKDMAVVRAPHRDWWLTFQKWRGQRLVQNQNSLRRPSQSLSPGKSIYFRLRSLAPRIVRWLEPRLYHPDLFQGWIKPAVAKAQQTWKKDEFQAILATGGPWSNFEIGYQLSKHWKVPLILDFRDGWTITSNDFRDRRPHWAQSWDRLRLGRYFMQAQGVIFLHGMFAESYLTAYPQELSSLKIHLIPNGFESIQMRAKNFPPQGDRLLITYAGTLAGIKFDTFMTAMASLLKEKPHLPLQVRFFADGSDAAKERVAGTSLENYITFWPPVSFTDCLVKLKESHALLLLGNHFSRGYETFIGSKIFSYLAMQRPVLGVVPPKESGMRQLLEAVKTGPLVDYNSVSQIKEALLTLHDAWQNNNLHNFQPDQEKLRHYSEPRLTESLVAALESSSPLYPYHRGEASIPPSLIDFVKMMKH